MRKLSDDSVAVVEALRVQSGTARYLQHATGVNRDRLDWILRNLKNSGHIVVQAMTRESYSKRPVAVYAHPDCVVPDSSMCSAGYDLQSLFSGVCAHG